MAAGKMVRHIGQKPKTVAAKADKALTVARKVQRQLTKQTEVKYVDVIASDAEVIGFSGDVTLLNPVAQGTDNIQRIGNKVNGKYLYIRGYIDNNQLQFGTVVRFIVFMDTENQGSTPTAADVLSITGDNQAVMAMINLDHTPRYKVLYDKTLTTSSAGNYHALFKAFIRLKGITQSYTGTTATDVYKNALYSLAIANVNTNDPTITFVSRYAYTDS